MIQLQHLDLNGNNLGGLYVRPEEIAAIFADEDQTIIVLKSGREFFVPFSINEMLDKVTH